MNSSKALEKPRGGILSRIAPIKDDRPAAAAEPSPFTEVSPQQDGGRLTPAATESTLDKARETERQRKEARERALAHVHAAQALGLDAAHGTVLERLVAYFDARTPDNETAMRDAVDLLFDLEPPLAS